MNINKHVFIYTCWPLSYVQIQERIILSSSSSSIHTHAHTYTHTRTRLVCCRRRCCTYTHSLHCASCSPSHCIHQVVFFIINCCCIASIQYSTRKRETERERERENKGGETERDREREGWRGQRVGWYASWLDNVHEVDLSRPWHSPRNNNNNNNIIIIRRSVRIRWTWKGPQNYNNKIQGGLGGRSEGGWELCDQCEQSLIKWEGGWAGGERIINKWRGRSNHIC